jgi:hypothetical protein
MLSFKQYLFEQFSPSSIERFEGSDYNVDRDIAAEQEKRKKAVMDDQYRRANKILKTVPSELRAKYIETNDLEGVLNYGKYPEEEIKKFDGKDMRKVGALSAVYTDVQSNPFLKAAPPGVWPGYVAGDTILYTTANADPTFNLEKEKGYNTDLGLMLDYEGHPKDENIMMNPAGREAVRRREKEGRSVQTEPYNFDKETAKMRKLLNPFGGGFMQIPKE